MSILRRRAALLWDAEWPDLMERFALTPEMLVPLGRVPRATLKRMREGIEGACDDPDLPVTLRRMVMGADVDPPRLHRLWSRGGR